MVEGRNRQIIRMKNSTWTDPKPRFIRIALTRTIATNLPSHRWARVQNAHFPRLVPPPVISPQAWRANAKNTRNYSSQFKISFSLKFSFSFTQKWVAFGRRVNYETVICTTSCYGIGDAAQICRIIITCCGITLHREKFLLILIKINSSF